MASPSLAISIAGGHKFYLDAKPLPQANLEQSLRSRIRAMGKDTKGTTVTVVAERGVPIEDVVYVLDIANKLQLKTILATDPKPEG
jgi:biopolymer transport protein ExbD